MITLPDLTNTTAAESELPIEVIAATGTDALDFYVYASRLEEYAKLIKETVKDEAVGTVADLGIKECFGSKVSLRETKVYDYGKDAQLDLYNHEQLRLKSEVDAVNGSVKARQKYLVETGAATLTETKTTIAISK